MPPETCEIRVSVKDWTKLMISIGKIELNIAHIKERQAENDEKNNKSINALSKENSGSRLTTLEKKFTGLESHKRKMLSLFVAGVMTLITTVAGTALATYLMTK